MIEIPLSKRSKKNAGKYVAIIDDIDSDLTELNWTATTGNVRYAIYSNNRCAPKQIYMHRMILERVLGRFLERGEQPDHKDGNGLNNVRSNLRVATSSQNNMNKRKQSNNTSGYKGVSWVKAIKKWRARIYIDGKETHLGVFNTREEAKKARDEAALKYHKEFARLD